MTNDIKKASIADVQIGLYTIQGLLSEDGEFGVAIPQIAEEFSISRTNAQRDIKSKLGLDFKFVKWRTEIAKRDVNILLLVDFYLGDLIHF